MKKIFVLSVLMMAILVGCGKKEEVIDQPFNAVDEVVVAKPTESPNFDGLMAGDESSNPVEVPQKTEDTNEGTNPEDEGVGEEEFSWGEVDESELPDFKTQEEVDSAIAGASENAEIVFNPDIVYDEDSDEQLSEDLTTLFLTDNGGFRVLYSILTQYCEIHGGTLADFSLIPAQTSSGGYQIYDEGLGCWYYAVVTADGSRIDVAVSYDGTGNYSGCLLSN